MTTREERRTELMQKLAEYITTGKPFEELNELLEINKKIQENNV